MQPDPREPQDPDDADDDDFGDETLPDSFRGIRHGNRERRHPELRRTERRGEDSRRDKPRKD